MDHTINKAKKIAKRRKIKAPRSLKVYMDDTLGIEQKNTSNTSHQDFITILNEIDPKIKFTFETEEKSKLTFLDTLVIREKDVSLSTTIYRKPSHTGLTINPRFCQDPKIWLGVFKGTLCRAYRLCSNQTLLRKEIEYLINNFEDNGYNRKKLNKIVKNYKPKKPKPKS